MLAFAHLTSLHCVLTSNPTHASGSLLVLQLVSDRLAARHGCWLCALIAQMCDAGRLAMLACAPLTCLLCFLLPYPTHASESLLILQHVSDRLAARHMLLVMCPQ
jgi:hypothetical protein